MADEPETTKTAKVTTINDLLADFEKKKATAEKALEAYAAAEGGSTKAKEAARDAVEERDAARLALVDAINLSVG